MKMSNMNIVDEIQRGCVEISQHAKLSFNLLFRMHVYFSNMGDKMLRLFINIIHKR